MSVKSLKDRTRLVKNPTNRYRRNKKHSRPAIAPLSPKAALKKAAPKPPKTNYFGELEVKLALAILENREVLDSEKLPGRIMPAETIEKPKKKRVRSKREAFDIGMGQASHGKDLTYEDRLSNMLIQRLQK